VVPEEAGHDVIEMSTVEEDREQPFVEFSQTRDPALRSALVEENMPLALHLARRFAHRGESLEDLEQVAALALVNAVDRYDPVHATAFAAYATRTILGELKRHFRDKGWMVRPPRRIQELCLELNRELERLTQTVGRSPTIRELAHAVGASEADVIEALDAAESYWAVSLDAPTAEGDSLGSRIGESDVEFDAVEQRASLAEQLSGLPEREQTILRLRFFDGLTQSEIAVAVGLSQMHVSRLLRTSLTTLRRAYGELTLGDVAEFDD
jgi:RNA polymerase sigma-B factor